MDNYDKRVGKFQVTASFEGHPHWTRIEYFGHGDDLVIRGIHHEDLPDLIYALSSLAQKLGERNREGR